MVKKWEYMWNLVHVNPVRFGEDEDTVGQDSNTVSSYVAEFDLANFNQYGDAGWELITVLQIPETYLALAYFKREKTD